MGRTNWHLFIKSSHTSLWVTIPIRSNQRRVSDFLLLDTVEEYLEGAGGEGGGRGDRDGEDM